MNVNQRRMVMTKNHNKMDVLKRFLDSSGGATKKKKLVIIPCVVNINSYRLLIHKEISLYGQRRSFRMY